MKYRYNLADVTKLFQLSETILINFIRLGKLKPENWDRLTEFMQMKFIAEKTLVFNREEVYKFISTMALENLKYYQLLDAVDKNTNTLFNAIERLDRIENRIVESNTPMKLTEFAGKIGYSVNYLRKKIKGTEGGTIGVLKLPGFNLITVKVGKCWTLNYMHYMEKFNKLTYDNSQMILKEIQNQNK